VLAELFGGRSALLDPPRPATIKTLVAFQAYWDRHPHLYDQICQACGVCRVGWHGFSMMAQYHGTCPPGRITRTVRSVA